jgi:hypothetical protein
VPVQRPSPTRISPTRRDIPRPTFEPNSLQKSRSNTASLFASREYSLGKRTAALLSPFSWVALAAPFHRLASSSVEAQLRRTDSDPLILSRSGFSSTTNYFSHRPEAIYCTTVPPPFRPPPTTPHLSGRSHQAFSYLLILHIHTPYKKKQPLHQQYYIYNLLPPCLPFFPIVALAEMPLAMP